MPSKKSPEPAATNQSAAYEELLKEYGGALEQLRSGKFQEAGPSFARVIEKAAVEPELAERAKMYLAICERRSHPEPGNPETPRDRYYKAVLLANSGRAAEAVELLTQALTEEPTAVDYLYARATSWALQNMAENAVTDLRQAVAIDPTVRFQATNDPDFDAIREDPSFIDIIEPTPTGA